MMIVIMNSKGEYARISRSSSHTGTRETLNWVDLNSAELFRDKIHRRDFQEKTFAELQSGIFIKAVEHRTVELLK